MGKRKSSSDKIQLKIKKITINGFDHYYCPIENDYFNLYRHKCPHLKEVYFDDVLLEITPEEFSSFTSQESSE